MTVPGSPHAMLMAQSGDPLDELGVIERSLRFRSSASAVLSRTPAAGNQTTWTWRKCVKRGKIGAEHGLYGAGLNASPTTHFCLIEFTSADRLMIYCAVASVTQFQLTTEQAFRDLLAHYDIQIVYDSTNATAADRIRMYINGVRVTTFNTATYPTLNFATYINTANTHVIGLPYSGHAANLDGYMSNACFVDGQALDPSSFGSFHPVTGQWRPKKKNAIKTVVDAGGVNSFFLPFDNPTNTTTLCADASVKGCNWTSTNISLTSGVAYDSILDTPTNNFPTLNRLVVIPSNGANTIENGNLLFTPTGAEGSVECSAVASIPFPASGRWQWEVTPAVVSTLSASRTQIGIMARDGINRHLGTGAVPGCYAYCTSGSTMSNGVGVAYGSAYAANDVVGCVFDADAGTLTFYKNGVSQGIAYSGLPATAEFYAAVGYWGTFNLNFGQRPLSYPVAGAKTLCTKNLPRPAITRPASAFVARTDTGTNIVATLAAAAPWSDWLRIYKRRDAAEGWRWQFADDAANYLDSSSTAAKAAFPALSGSYVGYALRVAASNGVATGRLVHTNGAADVVADGLSKARKLIILKNEATGSWYVYHPDLTAGKLLYLEQVAAETIDGTISAVGTSGFTVAAALASGTYRWIAIAEIGTFIKLGKYTGNGSTDGAFAAAELSSLMALVKNTTINNWVLHDAARIGFNPITAALYPNLTLADTAGNSTLDLLSNGFKVRAIDGSVNTNAGAYVYLSLAEFPFRYANAR